MEAASARPGEFTRHWRALLGCTLAASVGAIGLSAYTNGAFAPELIARAGYSREQLSFATLLLSATVAVIAPFVGQAIDRWGALRVIAGAVAGETLAFILFAIVPIGFGYFQGCILALALLGAGTTPPGYSRLVAERFDRHRGLALGLMISGLGLTAILAPILLTRVIGMQGWRGGYWALAGATAILGCVGLLLVRSDGPLAAAEVRKADLATAGAGGWGAVKRPLYWFILLCFATPSLCGAGFLLHLIGILLDRGFTPIEAARVQSLLGVAIIIGRFTSGWAMDRLFAPYVAGIAFAVSAVGTTLLLSQSGLLLSFAALAIGVTIGAELDILGFTLSRYFGLANFARLYGLAYSTMILAGGASPLFIAKLALGADFTLPVIVCASGLALSALGVSRLPRFASAVPDHRAR